MARRAGPHSVTSRRGLIALARGITPLQVSREPSDEVVVEGCCIECCCEFGMVHSVDMLIAVATVCRGGGRGLLKSVATLYTSGNRTEVVNL